MKTFYTGLIVFMKIFLSFIKKVQSKDSSTLNMISYKTE